MGALIRRFLLSRRGVAAVVALLVLVIVVLARQLGDGQRTTSSATDGVGASLSPTPSAASSTAAVDASPPNPTPVAVGFATAWVHHAGVTSQQWWTAVTRWTTAEEARQLVGVAPDRVPANRLTTPARITSLQAPLATVVVPTDTGLLVLGLAEQPGRTWLVDTVDWRQGGR